MIEPSLCKRYVDTILKSAFPFLLVPLDKQQMFLSHLQHAFTWSPNFREAVKCTYLASPSGIPPVGSAREELMNIVLASAVIQANEREVKAILTVMECAGGIESRREMALRRTETIQCIKI